MYYIACRLLLSHLALATHAQASCFCFCLAGEKACLQSVGSTAGIYDSEYGHDGLPRRWFNEDTGVKQSKTESEIGTSRGHRIHCLCVPCHKQPIVASEIITHKKKKKKTNPTILATSQAAMQVLGTKQRFMPATNAMRTVLVHKLAFSVAWVGSRRCRQFPTVMCLV